MAIITTSAMIGGIVTYLSGKLAKNESISGFVNEFTGATVDWIRPLFLKEDGNLQKELEKLKANPTPVKQNAIKTMLESELEDNKEAEQYIKEIYEKIKPHLNSSLNATNIEAKGDVTINVKQEKSKANMDNIKSGEGKINIDIQQE